MSALMAKKSPLKGHHLGTATRRDSDPHQLTIEAPALIRASGPIPERESRAAGGWPGAGRRWCGRGRRRRRRVRQSWTTSGAPERIAVRIRAYLKEMSQGPPQRVGQRLQAAPDVVGGLLGVQQENPIVVAHRLGLPNSRCSSVLFPAPGIPASTTIEFRG
jgi:hypothetical protein